MIVIDQQAPGTGRADNHYQSPHSFHHLVQAGREGTLWEMSQRLVSLACGTRIETVSFLLQTHRQYVNHHQFIIPHICHFSPQTQFVG